MLPVSKVVDDRPEPRGEDLHYDTELSTADGLISSNRM